MKEKIKEPLERENVNNFTTIWRPLKTTMTLVWQWERTMCIYLCLLAIVLGATTYLQFSSFSKIVNEILRLQSQKNANYKSLVYDSIILLLSFFVPAVLRQITQYLQTKSRFSFLRKLCLHISGKTADLDIATIESEEFEELLVKANSRGHMCINEVYETAIQNLENISSILMASVIVCSIAPILFVVALATSAPSFYFYKKYGLRVWWVNSFSSKRRRTYYDRQNLFVRISAVIELKLLQLKEKFLAVIEKLMLEFDGDMVVVERKRLFHNIELKTLEMVGLGYVIYYLVHGGLVGAFAIGTLLLAFNSYRSLYQALQTFFLLLGKQDEMGKYAQWWFDILALQPKIVSKPNALKPQWTKPPRIVFENVSFEYEGTNKFALQNISFVIESGEKTAIVGLNGAGKTTLIKLLCRIYNPTHGRITVGDIDIIDIDIEYWHECVAILFQDFVDYNLTVAESISLGRGNQPIDIAKVKDAAMRATADDFIMKYPNKYQQLLWKGFEDGVEPSKGQRQKIAVSRIFYRNAFISILDEPTSAIDAVSEDQIFQELESLPRTQTAILISHRMSAIKNSDNIIVLKDGCVFESGTHAELMSIAGEYFTLFTTQTKRIFDQSEQIETM